MSKRMSGLERPCLEDKEDRQKRPAKKQRRTQEKDIPLFQRLAMEAAANSDPNRGGFEEIGEPTRINRRPRSEIRDISGGVESDSGMRKYQCYHDGRVCTASSL